jgi:hypothetical protein
MVTLNDPVFVEAASALSERVRKATPDDPKTQISQAYELATAHPPDGYQIERLQELYLLNRDEMGSDAAAMETVCRTILNLDEVLVKR